MWNYEVEKAKEEKENRVWFLITALLTLIGLFGDLILGMIRYIF